MGVCRITEWRGFQFGGEGQAIGNTWEQSHVLEETFYLWTEEQTDKSRWQQSSQETPTKVQQKAAGKAQSSQETAAKVQQMAAGKARKANPRLIGGPTQSLEFGILGFP